MHRHNVRPGGLLAVRVEAGRVGMLDELDATGRQRGREYTALFFM
jgi:hypothetical protein